MPSDALVLTSSQKETFDKFKAKVKDITKPNHDDFYLVKWLKARSWDIPKAEKMFRDDQEWRRVNEIDKLVTSYEPPEVLEKYYPGGIIGQTKDGYPVWIETLATADQKGLYNCVTKKEVLRFKEYFAEKLFNVRCPEISQQLGKRIDMGVYIIDLDGLTLKHLWKPAIDIYIEMVSTAEAHYPEALKAAYVINAPAIFPIAYSIVKPFLSEDTRKKIKVIGANYKEHLLKEIPADQLPVHWGGTDKDPDGDPYCRSRICMGGTVPEKYYRKKMLTENNDLSKFTAATVQKGTSLQLDFEVKVKKSLLSWNFFTDENDIAFGVYRKTSADQRQKAADMEPIVQSERVNSHVIPEAGSIQCDQTGSYVVRFDNNYSWINNKKLYYLIEVVEPDVGKELQRLDSTDF